MILSIEEITDSKNEYCLKKYKANCNNELTDLNIEMDRTSVKIILDDYVIQRAEFDGLPILIGAKGKKGSYKVYSQDEMEIGKIDELVDTKGKFAILINELLYVCKKYNDDEFLVSSMFGVGAYIKRFDNGSRYDCYHGDSICNIDLSMIATLIERKWFIDEDFECLYHQGLKNEAERIKFPIFSKSRMVKLYNKELKGLVC